MSTPNTLGQPFNDILGMPEIAGDILRLAVHGAGTWLGLYLGTKETGLVSIVGYTVGALNGLGAVFDAASIVKQL